MQLYFSLSISSLFFLPMVRQWIDAANDDVLHVTFCCCCCYSTVNHLYLALFYDFVFTFFFPAMQINMQFFFCSNNHITNLLVGLREAKCVLLLDMYCCHHPTPNLCYFGLSTSRSVCINTPLILYYNAQDLLITTALITTVSF